METSMSINISKRITLKIEFPRPIITPFCILTESMMSGRMYVLILPFTIFTLEVSNKLPLKDKE